MSTVSGSSRGFSLGAAFPPLPVCRLSVETYEEMIRAGIITEDDPIELLDGWITEKMTKNSPHLAATVAVNQTLVRALPRGWSVVPEHPIRLATSMPEPDVMVVRGDAHTYIDRLPRAEDVELVVEISDTSLSRDQGLKKSIYAQAGIPCYWLVNLVDRRIEEYTDPVTSGENADYRQSHRSRCEQAPREIAGLYSCALTRVAAIASYRGYPFDEVSDLHGLGLLLILLRIARGLTQREMAKRLGVHESLV
jgi:Uma2 family endonuclease